jgi:Nucleotidyl transferase AbiEii toxin, Type IV TA system
MAVTPFQRTLCRLLAADRRARGDSYVAGGVALGLALDAQRLSRDLDLFHDTTQSVAATWDADRKTMEANGYQVAPVRERPGFVQATVSLRGEALLVEWVHDSAYRFFPLVEHEDLGLTLHPFDLATNKVLALIGRVEVRDWVDVLSCDQRLQPLGYLAWAACGKDPGFSPISLLDHARRTARYSAAEVATLTFEGDAPDAALLSRQWQEALSTALEIVRELPADHIGSAVLTASGELARVPVSEIRDAVARGTLKFHPGRVGGAWPTVVPVG